MTLLISGQRRISNSNSKDEMRGSLHCATDDETVCCFGRDDTGFWSGERKTTATATLSAVDGFVGLGGFEAEAAPGFGDDDAVAGVVGGVADLDGEVGADVVDEFGEGGDVLGALVGDAGDAVVVDDDVGGGGGFFGCGWGGIGLCVGLRDEGVHDGAVGDAAGAGEEFAALAFELFFGGFVAREEVDGGACRGGYGGAGRGDDSRGAEVGREMSWIQQVHRRLQKRIVEGGWVWRRGCCGSNPEFGGMDKDVG